jgi:hypothetical protein
MLWQHNRIILKIKLEAHHVLSLLHIQNLKHLLSNVQLVVLLKICRRDTGASTLRFDIIEWHAARRIRRLDTRTAIILTNLTTSFTSLTKLTTNLRHQIKILVR